MFQATGFWGNLHAAIEKRTQMSSYHYVQSLRRVNDSIGFWEQFHNSIDWKTTLCLAMGGLVAKSTCPDWDTGIEIPAPSLATSMTWRQLCDPWVSVLLQNGDNNESPYNAAVRIQQGNTCKLLRTLPGTRKHLTNAISYYSHKDFRRRHATIFEDLAFCLRRCRSS